MIAGQLAERWEFTKEGMIFHLRRGIQFQGKPGVMKSREMTADDVVFSLRRAIDSPKRTFKYGWYKSIEVVDKYTVLVKMNYHSIVLQKKKLENPNECGIISSPH